MGLTGCEGIASVPAASDSNSTAPATQLSEADVRFLDTLQARTFDWFSETTNPENGLTPDRAPEPPFASIAAVRFARSTW